MANNFTRPNDTTAYASGDLVANSTTAGSVVPLSYPMGLKDAYLRRVKLTKSTNVTTNANFRVHFYTASPTCTNGDNGAWLTTLSGYIGCVDVTVDKAFSNAASGQGVPVTGTGTEINWPEQTAQAAATLFALVEARAAYTPGAQEVFTVTLEFMNFGS